MVRAYHKERRARYPEKVRRIERNSYLKAQYGITLEDYDDLLDQQSLCCPLCDCCLIYVANVSVDHCHETGKVRGILCGKCNKALGLVADNAQTLERMIEYVR